MVWHAPFTFVAGDTISYDDLNKYLVDNMNETLIGRIKSGVINTNEGKWFTTDGGLPNSVVGYDIKYAETAANTSGARTSTSYGVPTPSFGSYVNPSITITTGARALVLVQLDDVAKGNCTTETEGAYCSVAVSGASTIAASDTYSCRSSGIFPQDTSFPRFNWPKDQGFFRWFTTLNPGSNTFTLQIRGTAADQTVVGDPSMVVIPFG